MKRKARVARGGYQKSLSEKKVDLQEVPFRGAKLSCNGHQQKSYSYIRVKKNPQSKCLKKGR